MADTSKPILVWRFHDAPEDLQALSTNGGDEDWIALLPAGMFGYYVDLDEPESSHYTYANWLDSHGFGSSVDAHPLPDGRLVLIGSHA